MKSRSIPQLRFHRSTNRYYVWDAAAKSRRYLGTDQAEAERRYHILVAAIPIMGSSGSLSRAEGPVAMTVGEAFIDYLQRHARGYYRSARQWHMIQTALSAAADQYGSMPVSHFAGPQLKALQTAWLKRESKSGRCRGNTWSRQYVNKLIGCVRRAFLWLVTESIVPPAVHQALALTPDIGKDRGGREAERVTPPPAWAVDATLTWCRPTLRAMLELQRLTGMRPQDVCGLRPCDVSRSPSQPILIPGTHQAVAAREVDDVLQWAYVPASHKTLWAGKPKVVPIGPRAQAILNPYLESTSAEEFCFQPRRLRAEYHAERRRTRKTKVQPSQESRGVENPKRPPSAKFNTGSYAHALTNAIKRANGERSKQDLPPIPRWTPNQLRHEAGTRIGDAFDRAHAAAVLGNPSAIDVYMEQSLGKAFKAAAQLG